jgi:DNA-directed RNA polymerase specialized sigma24 family protein
VGAPDRFPSTRGSVLAALAGRDEAEAREAWEALAGAYWAPVHAYLERRWGEAHHDAQDLTQEFFARAQTGRFFEGYDPAKARFRTFLRICLDRFVMNQRESAAALKRGGGHRHESLDGTDGSAEAVADPAADPELQFQREWVRALFAGALQSLERRMEERGRRIPYAVFVAYDIEGPDAPERPSYEALARRHEVSVTQVTNFLSATRKEFRREVLARLRALTGSEEEFRAEARELLGWDPA